MVIDPISKQIRNPRLIDEGYIWVNHIVNYCGGGDYAIRQIHPNLPHTEGIWFSTTTTDIIGNRPYEVELNGIKKNGELFFQYYFKKLNSDIISHKCHTPSFTNHMTGSWLLVFISMMLII